MESARAQRLQRRRRLQRRQLQRQRRRPRSRLGTIHRRSRCRCSSRATSAAGKTTCRRCRRRALRSTTRGTPSAPPTRARRWRRLRARPQASARAVRRGRKVLVDVHEPPRQTNARAPTCRPQSHVETRRPHAHGPRAQAPSSLASTADTRASAEVRSRFGPSPMLRARHHAYVRTPLHTRLHKRPYTRAHNPPHACAHMRPRVRAHAHSPGVLQARAQPHIRRLARPLPPPTAACTGAYASPAMSRASRRSARQRASPAGWRRATR
mmetsp:Transcript_9992/g.19468  ORF Transcript_9992/g.19468 Transcript_9992/m.19468 type:complete len:267 (+) Transcript_9992:130-930(+)